MSIGLGHYLTVAAILFTLGIFGIFLNRKNVIVILMSVELMLLAVNINLVAFSSFMGDLVGQVFALFVLTLRQRGGVQRQRVADQVSRRRDDVLSVQQVPTGSGAPAPSLQPFIMLMSSTAIEPRLR